MAPRRGFFLRGGQESFALGLFPGLLTGAPDRLALLAGPSLGWLFIGSSRTHLAKHAFALHLALEDAESLIDVVFANENLHWNPF